MKSFFRYSLDSLILRLRQWTLVLFISALSIMGVGKAFAADACVSLEKLTSSNSALDKAIRYYEDPSAAHTVKEILGEPVITWKSLKETTPSFGFSNSAFWLHFDLCPSGNHLESLVLEVAYPLLDHIQVFGVTGKSVVYQMSSGDSIPFTKRPSQHRNFVFFLPKTHQDVLSVFIRIQTTSAVQVPLRVLTQSDFFWQNQRTLLMQGIYFGIILAMILYNTFLFFSLREYPYLLYVLFTTCYLCFQGVLQGLFQQFFFDSVWLQNHTLLIFGYTSILFANLFAISFLKLRTNNPLLCHILHGIGAVSALAAAFSSVLPYEIMVKMMLILAIPSSLLIMSAGFRLWWSGHLPARIFAIAWTTLLVSFVLASFNKFGILPRTIWTEDIMQIGGVLEVILLSIALGERVNEEKRQRILVEQRLASSLEAEVLKRTEELNIALAQLESANAILDQISHTDSLTQIANRRAFDSEMINAYRGARRENQPLALIILDIDHFKSFNDTLGHQAGDKALQEVAGVLAKHATRPGDKVFRYGGEEFAVLLKSTDLGGARVVAERMRLSIAENRIDIDGEMYSVTISGGIAVYDPGTDKQQDGVPDHLIHRADKCLYQAKERGRNQIELEVS
jgi:two-component system, sensor histidine kinase LadS